MRDEDDGVRVVVQVLLEPVARVEVEVVGRLVEQQQVRPRRAAAWRARCASASRPRTSRSGRSRSSCAEAEALQHGGDLQVDAVAVVQAEAVLEVAVAREHLLVLAVGDVRVAEALLELVHLGLHVEQRLEGQHRLLEDRAARVRRGRPAAGSRRVRSDGLTTRPASQLLEPRAASCSSVVLPAPFGPQRPTRSPSEICQVTLSKQHPVAEGLGEGGELDQWPEPMRKSMLAHARGHAWPAGARPGPTRFRGHIMADRRSWVRPSRADRRLIRQRQVLGPASRCRGVTGVGSRRGASGGVPAGRGRRRRPDRRGTRRALDGRRPGELQPAHQEVGAADLRPRVPDDRPGRRRPRRRPGDLPPRLPGLERVQGPGEVLVVAVSDHA